MQSHRKRNKHNSLFIISYLVISISISQSEVYDGNLLISPKDIQNQIYITSLIDNDYNIINTWDTDCPVASMGYTFTLANHYLCFS